MRLALLHVILIGLIFFSLSSSAQAQNIDRHYFEGCNAKNIVSLQEGMSQRKARKLCGGHEFPALESVRNGFHFTLDEKHLIAITIPGWIPKPDQKIDFFCSRELVVLAYYDERKNIKHLTKLPLPQPAAQSKP